MMSMIHLRTLSRKIKLVLLSILYIFSTFSPTFGQIIYNNKYDKDSKFFLTKEEIEYIKQNPVLTIVSASNWAPYEYFNKNDESYHGINIELIKKIANKIGISINQITTKDYYESIEYFKEGKADLISGYTELLKDQGDFYYTDVIFSAPLLLISATGELPKNNDTITLTALSKNTMRSIYEKFPPSKFNYKFTTNSEETIQSFESKKSKFIMIGTSESIFITPEKEHKSFPLPIDFQQRLAINEKYKDTLLPIINRAIKSINPEEFSFIIHEQNILSKKLQSEEITYSRNKMLFLFYALVVLTCFVLIIAIVLLFLLKYRTKSFDFDSITKLSTLKKFESNAKKILKKAKNNEYVILSLNIDNFKYISDSYGINHGNNLLNEVAKHFSKECKSDELLCRYYADNFIFLLKNPAFFWLLEERVYKMTQIDNSIKKLLPENYDLSFSSSVYYIENNNLEIEAMINKANVARKMTKQEYQTHRVIEYTKDMEEENEWNRDISISMNSAIQNQEFQVYYQPKYLFTDEKIIGAEALIRWNNPKKGFLAPGQFVPFFESNGFIEKIDKYVLKQVCAFLENWAKINTTNESLTISFNLSRCHLSNPDLVGELKSIISSYNIGNNKIEVELTENIMLDNQKRLIKTMNEIKDAGFSVSVDDFGAGYSSLNMLKNMPADVIKLDKEFLSNCPENQKEFIIITSVIEMAKKLQIKTVAEGVETKVQSDMLKELGCDIAQGFYYAKPMPEKEFLELLKKQFIQN